MSLPKITARHPHVVRLEFDPYREPLSSGRIVRKIYEDGFRALYVNDHRVCSIQYMSLQAYPDPIFVFSFADGSDSFYLHNASLEEGFWFQKSMEDLGLNELT